MALEITPERVQAAAERLAGGGWQFTSRQLYYAVCRDIEVPRTRVAPGELGLGILLVMVGAITGQRVAFAILAALGILLLLIGVVTHVAERRPEPESRLLAVSFDTFRADHLEGMSHHGLVGDQPATAPADATTVVLCDRPETTAMLRANAAQLGVPVRVEDAGALHELTGVTSVVVLHDAAPSGCAMAADARDRGLEVVDAGLNPGDVIGRRLQVIEGAPARLPRDLSSHLPAAELAWLVSGRRLELAALSPEETVLRVRAALAGGDDAPAYMVKSD